MSNWERRADLTAVLAVLLGLVIFELLALHIPGFSWSTFAGVTLSLAIPHSTISKIWKGLDRIL